MKNLLKKVVEFFRKQRKQYLSAHIYFINDKAVFFSTTHAKSLTFISLPGKILELQKMTYQDFNKIIDECLKANVFDAPDDAYEISIKEENKFLRKHKLKSWNYLEKHATFISIEISIEDIQQNKKDKYTITLWKREKKGGFLLYKTFPCDLESDEAFKIVMEHHKKQLEGKL